MTVTDPNGCDIQLIGRGRLPNMHFLRAWRKGAMRGTPAVRRVPRSLAAEIERAERAAGVEYLLILEDNGERSFQAGLVEYFEPISAVPDL